MEKTFFSKPSGLPLVSDTNQEIFLKEINTEEAVIEKPLSQADIDALVRGLLQDLEKNNKYNQINDEFYTNVGTRAFSSKEIEALRISNRSETKTLGAALDQVIASIEKELEDIDYSVSYDKSEHDLALIADFLFPGHTPGELNYSQIKEVKKLIKEFKALKANNIVNKKIKNKLPQEKSLPNTFSKTTEINNKEELFSKALSYQVDKSNKKTYDPKPKETLGFLISDFINKLSPEEKDGKYERADFFIDLLHLDDNLKEEEASFRPENLGPKVGLIPLLGETRKTRQTVYAIEDTLNAIDEQNSFIGNLFGNRTAKDIRAKSNKQDAQRLSDVFDFGKLQDCFDCFEQGYGFVSDEAIQKIKNIDFKDLSLIGNAGAGEKDGGFFTGGSLFSGNDFSFGVEIEAEIRKNLETAKALYEKIRFAADIEYHMKQNYCSLLRLGSLCPLEMLFILAALTGLFMFAWTEIFQKGNFGADLLLDIFLSGILLPLLRVLQMSLRLTIAPLPNFTLCTFKSLKSIQDIDSQGKQYGLTLSEWSEGLADPEKSPNSSKILSVFKSGDGGVSLNQDQIGKSINDALTSRDNKFLASITNPLFGRGDAVDSLEMIKAAISDFVGKAAGSSDLIKSALDAIRSLSKKEIDSNLTICTKIMALSQIISLIGALYKAAQSTPGFEPCIPMLDEDGNRTNESPWNPYNFDENQDFPLNDFFGKTPVYEDSEERAKEKEKNPQKYLINPITDNRFNLTNCDRAKSSIISKGESLEFWRRVALGANVDNV